MNVPPKVLVADDQDDVLESLRLLLKTANYQVVAAASPGEAIAAVEREDLDVALIDLNFARDTTSGGEGLDLLARLRAFDEALPVIVMTAWGSVEGAVQAMGRGARDYIQKPWENSRVLATLKTQTELRRALQSSQRLESEGSRQRREALPALVVESPAMKQLLRVMERIGPSDANVLVTGEHGTGKEVIARWLHSASHRASKAFVAVNAGALSDGVFESELFGHVRGAFTDAKADRVGCFESADGGTLFLDEIGNMPLAQEAKLLRVLQTGEFHQLGSSKLRHANVRVLSATNTDIAGAVGAGRFREDLLYRLNTVELHLPALRERREDIPILALTFLAGQSARYGKTLTGFSPAALAALIDHNWPGNVRELEHAVERSVLMAQGSAVEVEDLTFRTRRGGAPSLEQMTLDQVERTLVEKALGRYHGNVSEAAQSLGLSRSALYRRIVAFGLKGVG